MQWFPNWRRSLLTAALLAGVGCSSQSSDRPQTVPVSGVVTYQGRPVEGATVTLHPRSPGLHSAIGRTNSEGRFQLRTFADHDGAVPGEYDVTVSAFAVTIDSWDGDSPPPEDYQPSPAKQLVPTKYGNARTSGLTASIDSEKANELLLKLED